MSRRIVLMSLLLVLLTVVLVYWPGLSGDFLFDDRPNILDNPRYRFTALTWDVLVQIVGSGDSGTLKRPIPMLSFALNVASTGFHPFYFKLWNLAIHVMNTVLVFVVVNLTIRAFGRRMQQNAGSAPWVALGAAALWGLHPLNLTSVLYVVQRMNSLCATFTLIALATYLWGRIRLMSGDRRGWWSLLGGTGMATILGLLSKENAVLIPLFVAVMEATLLRFDAAHPRDSKLLKMGVLGIAALTVLVVLVVIFVQPRFVFEGYIFRDFSPMERMLTQARVLFFYLQLTVAPSTSQLGLFHDDFLNSTGIMQPPATAAAIGGLVALVACAIAAFRKQPVISFAILWFLAGHLLESTILPLEMIHEHRNYLPILGPLIAASYYLCTSQFSSHSAVLRWLLVLFCVALAAVTWSRAYAWGTLVRHSEHEVANHPKSQRSLVQLGRIYFTLYVNEQNEAYLAEAEKYFRQSTLLPGNQYGGYVGIIRLAYVAHREPPREVVEEFIRRLATEPAAPSTTTLLQNLSNCNMFEYCKIADDDMLRMFDALLQNKGTHPTLKAVASVLLAQYVVDRLGDGLTGIRVLELGKELQPSVMSVRRNLIRMYRLSGQLERAGAELAEARKFDQLREIGPELDREEILLKEAIAAGKDGSK